MVRQRRCKGVATPGPAPKTGFRVGVYEHAVAVVAQSALQATHAQCEPRRCRRLQRWKLKHTTLAQAASMVSIKGASEAGPAGGNSRDAAPMKSPGTRSTASSISRQSGRGGSAAKRGFIASHAACFDGSRWLARERPRCSSRATSASASSGARRRRRVRPVRGARSSRCRSASRTQLRRRSVWAPAGSPRCSFASVTKVPAGSDSSCFGRAKEAGASPPIWFEPSTAYQVATRVCRRFWRRTVIDPGRGAPSSRQPHFAPSSDRLALHRPG
jgi:hypothetical protein